MAFVRKRKGRKTPTIRFWDPALGRRREISAESEEAKKIKAKRVEIEKKLGQNEPIDAEVNKITFDDGVKLMYADYRRRKLKSIADLTFSVDNHLLPYFGGWRLTRMTYTAISEYLEKREAGETEPTQVKKLKRKAALGTMRRELAAIRRVFKLALIAGKITAMPAFPKIAKPKPRKGFFEPYQLDAIKDELLAKRGTRTDGQLYCDMLDLYEACGWRKRNLMLLEWTNVNRFDGSMTVDTGETKTGDPLTFPYASDPALKAIIERRWKAKEFAEQESGHKVPWVFFRYTPKRTKWTPVAPQPVKGFRGALQEAAKRAAKKLGDPTIETRLIHDFRRTAVRRLNRAKTPPKVIMDITGHKTTSVFLEYNITNDADAREAVAAAARVAAREKRSRKGVGMGTADNVLEMPEKAVGGSRGGQRGGQS